MRLSSLLAGLAGLLLVPSLALLVGFAGSAPAARQTYDEATPVFPPWGITLQTDAPFYRAGDTALVSAALVNSSGRDAYGWALSLGGNGCQYNITIRDGANRVVWQPGSIVGGQFSGPGCFFAQRILPFPNRTSLEYKVKIPLIYQNAGGIGVLGTRLPPDYYQVHIEATFIGPQRSPAFLPGLNFIAAVPIQIEP